MAEQLANLANSTLATAIDASQTTANLIDASAFSATGTYRVTVDNEIIIVGGRTGNQLTGLTRAAEGTTAAPHNMGAVVAQTLTAAGLTTYIQEQQPAPAPILTFVKRSAGNITISSTTFVEIATALRLSVPATIGDLLAVSISVLVLTGSASNQANDIATIVSGAIINRFAGSTHGNSGWLLNLGGQYQPMNGTIYYNVQSADISAGTVTISPVSRRASGANGALYHADAALPMQVSLQNLGQ